MKTKYCHYCRSTKPAEGFKLIRNSTASSIRNQCVSCQAIRKKPREELEQLARQDAANRNKNISDAVKRSIEERKKK